MTASVEPALAETVRSNVTPFPGKTRRQVTKARPRVISKDTYAHIPEHVVESEAFSSLNSFAAVRILLHAAAQYRRPDKPIALPVVELAQRGYGSKTHVGRAIERLEKARLLVRVKEHGNGQCALFALGWKRGDER